jgi:hypothetical protein
MQIYLSGKLENFCWKEKKKVTWFIGGNADIFPVPFGIIFNFSPKRMGLLTTLASVQPTREQVLYSNAPELLDTFYFRTHKSFWWLDCGKIRIPHQDPFFSGSLVFPIALTPFFVHHHPYCHLPPLPPVYNLLYVLYPSFIPSIKVRIFPYSISVSIFHFNSGLSSIVSPLNLSGLLL